MMRHVLTALAVSFVAAGILAGDSVWAQDGNNNRRRNVENLQLNSRAAGRIVYGSNRPLPKGGSAVVRRSPYVGGYCYPSYSQGYGYRPYYRGRHYYPRAYYRGNYSTAPVFIPAQTLYGPSAVWRFMGVR